VSPRRVSVVRAADGLDLTASVRPPRDDHWFVKTNDKHATAAGHSVDVAGWLEEFDSGFAYIAGQFGRVEPRKQARAFLLGLLSAVDSRNCWALAEQAGDVASQRMQRMQRLLGEACGTRRMSGMMCAAMRPRGSATRRGS
jgi:hypothetical protein